MDFEKKMINKAYSPYRKEAYYCFFADCIVSLLGAIVFIVMNVHTIAPELFFIFPAFFLVEFFVNYRLATLSIIENCSMCYETETVNIISIRREDSASSHWGSVVPKLYPKQQYVDRYKLICYDKNGKKLYLRSIMSGKKWQILNDKLTKEKLLKRTVMFGKYSRIVLAYRDSDDLSYLLRML